MDAIVHAPWLAVAAPLALGAVVAVLGSRWAPYSRWLAMLGPVIAGVIGAAYLASGAEEPVVRSVQWLALGHSPMQVGYLLDGLGALMLVVVGVVAAMVMLFSVGYMAGEKGLARYYAVLSLFTASMCLLVLADGFVTLFIAWELVGACSYLLIGFWHAKPSAASAAVKAFLVTRVGDVGLFLAVTLIWTRVQALSYEAVLGDVPALGPMVAPIALLLFLGAAGKSAQFPLHIWLPDAMEGPTPVSALIHAATMVAAGVFLVARTWPIFEAAPAALTVVLWIGTLTAFGAACAALAQRDIKKVLAYSTISQLGFMFAALGAGAWVAAVFHLVTHAGFKALLFLAAGSVIHGSGTQDLREMGGLARRMPVTAATWCIGAAALAGVPGLAGFFSKDEILHGVLKAQPIAGAALAVAAAFTAFYITRATALAFFGPPAEHGHAHEGGWSMRIPLLVLAVPALLAGFAGHFIAEAVGGEAEALDPIVAGVSAAIALAGIAAGWLSFRRGVASDEAYESRLGAVWPVLRGAFGIDALVARGITAPTVRFAGALYSAIDRGVVDRAVEGLGTGSVWLGRKLASLQSGDGQWYAALMGAGVIVLLAIGAYVVR